MVLLTIRAEACYLRTFASSAFQFKQNPSLCPDSLFYYLPAFRQKCESFHVGLSSMYFCFFESVNEYGLDPVGNNVVFANANACQLDIFIQANFDCEPSQSGANLFNVTKRQKRQKSDRPENSAHTVCLHVSKAILFW